MMISLKEVYSLWDSMALLMPAIVTWRGMFYDS